MCQHDMQGMHINVSQGINLHFICQISFSYASFYIMYLNAVLMYRCSALFFLLLKFLDLYTLLLLYPLFMTIPKHLIFGNIKLMFSMYIISEHSGPSGQHSSFMFWRPWIHISTRRSPILTEFSVVFRSPLQQILGWYLKLGHYSPVMPSFNTSICSTDNCH